MTTPTEEAALRTIIAEREGRLARMLLDPYARRDQLQELRASIERLRKELQA